MCVSATMLAIKACLVICLDHSATKGPILLSLLKNSFDTRNKI